MTVLIQVTGALASASLALVARLKTVTCAATRKQRPELELTAVIGVGHEDIGNRNMVTAPVQRPSQAH